ncbi:hypothetical protein ACFWPQ_49355, partial [Streptomyces sp. NPDC058464]|uniref:hypothetical protein n=1 Tax=Streptomyces sp. NPDC058464 TaxID=3346511 RepID=UPI003666A7F8
MTAESAPPVHARHAKPVPEPVVHVPLPPGGGFRRFLALFALNWPGMLLVISAVLSGKLQGSLVDDL